MATSTRKRGATFLLEKPLVSRLPFEVEQPFSSTFPPPKRIKPAGKSTLDRQGRPYADVDVESETGEMQEIFHREEVDAVDVEVGAERACWLSRGSSTSRDKRSGGGENEQGGQGASSCVGVQELATAAVVSGKL